MFSWYSVRIVLCVDIFLMHLWGEMNFMSSYSSTILTPLQRFLKSESIDESFQNLGAVIKFFADD